MDDEEMLMIAVVAVVVFFFYKDIKKTASDVINVLDKPVDPIHAEEALLNAGLKKEAPGFYTSKDIWGTSTTFRVYPDEPYNLNFAQKLLIGADRFVPGTFLTRWALT